MEKSLSVSAQELTVADESEQKTPYEQPKIEIIEMECEHGVLASSGMDYGDGGRYGYTQSEGSETWH